MSSLAGKIGRCDRQDMGSNPVSLTSLRGVNVTRQPLKLRNGGSSPPAGTFAFVGLMANPPDF